MLQSCATAAFVRTATHQRRIGRNCCLHGTSILRSDSVGCKISSSSSLPFCEEMRISSSLLSLKPFSTYLNTSLSSPLQQQPTRQPPQQQRWKHSARMGHKLQTLDEMAHRPEREAAQERRQKKKDRKAAKKSHKKKGTENEDEIAAASAGGALPSGDVEGEEFWLDENEDDFGDHDDEDGTGGGNDEDEEPSLPDPKEVQERMMTIIAKFQESMKTIRGAEPTPDMFDDVQVNAYGSMTPLKAVGQVVITSPTLAEITCFDPSVAKDVQKAIQLTLELNPQLDEGGMLRVPLPRVSMEVREQTAKQLQKKAESCKRRIREVRRKAMDAVKKGKDGKLAGVSKDDAFANGKEVETVTETVMEKLKKTIDEKMDSIMAV